MTINVYEQYFKADALIHEIQRNGVKTVLTCTSEEGNVSYDIQVVFFPHRDAEDFAVSYDAELTKNIYQAKGRRSHKRELAFLKDFRKQCDEMAETFHAVIDWDEPLTQARIA